MPSRRPSPPELPPPLTLLPPKVRERARLDNHLPTRLRADGEFVLYWMRTAVRGHDNPALDAAVVFARALEVPVLVYHGLSERYPWASDRHHRFILEGATDVARELHGRSIPYAFHLERPGHRQPALKLLAARAALVVTEEFPVAPIEGWTASLSGWLDSHGGASVVRVDTACIAPLPLVGRRYERAFEFKAAVKTLQSARLHAVWEDEPGDASWRLPPLPFEAVPVHSFTVESPELDVLIAACEIDHGVAPVPHTRGGSKAGYARWAAFRDHALRHYHWRRNDAAESGVSRMSAWLHYGHVSPFRIARETARAGGPGADKYLEELLVWRELSWAFCRFLLEDDDGSHGDMPLHASLAALPAWARDTLARHESDERPVLLPMGVLRRGRTGDHLWDAAQTSLFVHGELHNNVRMTWGKALLQWSQAPAQALARLVELNDRYALDGRDPSSYGGILWCLGAFDRPFGEDVSVSGTLRSRTTSSHAERLDMTRYSARVTRSIHPRERPLRVAVIGGGVSGAAAARTLADHRLAVTVYDRGRGPGGRVSSKRLSEGLLPEARTVTASTEEAPPSFLDHGAPCFEVTDPRFGRFVSELIELGVVARWRGRFGLAPATGGPVDLARVTPTHEERWVALPSMSRFVKHLLDSDSASLDAALGDRPLLLTPAMVPSSTVTAIARDGEAWRVTLADGQAESYDAVIVAVPATSATALLRDVSPLASLLDAVRYDPAWVAWCELSEGAGRLPFDGIDAVSPAIRFAAASGSKPRRDGQRVWSLTATPAWAASRLLMAPDEVALALTSDFSSRFPALGPLTALGAHRWRDARVTNALGVDFGQDPSGTLIAVGDAFLGSTVENAWLSGVAGAGALLRHLATTAPPEDPGFRHRDESGQLALPLE